MAAYLAPEEAAKRLGLHPTRIRALIAAGELQAEKISGRWLVDPSSVALRAHVRPPAGRPFAAHNAWALIFLASGEEAPWISLGVRWRLQRALELEGLVAVAPRLGRRAKAHYFNAHPGELSHLRRHNNLVLGGISAASSMGLDLVPAEELDAYVDERHLAQVQRAHALEPVLPTAANVVLRVVPDEAWHFKPKRPAAPAAAVALDLVEASDPRSARSGQELLHRLSSQADSSKKIHAMPKRPAGS